MANVFPGVTVLALETPIVNNPPTLNDVANAVKFRKEGKKRRKLDPVAISEEAVLKSIVNEHVVISKYTAADAAPPWFTVAMDDLKESMQSMEKRFNARVFNGTVRCVGDSIRSPISPIPQGFPQTILALGNLSAANCNSCMTAFSLTLPPDAPNNVVQKREIIAEYLGIRLQSTVE
eukprot:gene28493-37445_t